MVSIPRKDRSAFDAGFTLLELLIALTLLSMITLVILGALGIGARVWERTSEEQSTIEETTLARNFLRRWIEQAYPLFDRSDPLRPVVVFQGTSERLDLVAPVPAGIAQGGLAQYSISVQPIGGEGHLVVSFRHERADNGASLHPSSILLENVSVVRWSYFGAQRFGEPDTWHDSWTDRSNLPRLVRLSIEFPAGDSRNKIEVEAAPKVRVPADCEYNPLTQSCRGY